VVALHIMGGLFKTDHPSEVIMGGGGCFLTYHSKH